LSRRGRTVHAVPTQVGVRRGAPHMHLLLVDK